MHGNDVLGEASRLAARSAARLAALVALLAVGGCGNGAGPGDIGGQASFALATMVFGPEDTTSYVNLLASIEPQTVTLDGAREFAGLADVWGHDGSLFVTELDRLTITRFAVDGGMLVETGQVSFASYGLTDFGFWLNTFVSPTKAYFLDRAGQYIVWNPRAMEIIGTLPLPELPVRDGRMPFPGYSDRAALIRDGLLYQPVYWADESFFEFTPDSRIVVIDTAHDAVVEVLEAPCPGLDYATRDEAGNLYFSSWVFAPGGAALLAQPPTCVVKVASGGNTVEKLFDVAALAGGRQGGVMRYLGDGRALLSVLHHDNATSTDVEEVAYGANWRFWSVDLATGSASIIDAFDWNAGAAYPASAGGSQLALVPAGDYTGTKVYELGVNGTPRELFDTGGWSVRLFEVR